MVSSGRELFRRGISDKTFFPDTCLGNGDFNGLVYAIVVIARRKMTREPA
jgi:hypothetical protein